MKINKISNCSKKKMNWPEPRRDLLKVDLKVLAKIEQRSSVSKDCYLWTEEEKDNLFT